MLLLVVERATKETNSSMGGLLKRGADERPYENTECGEAERIIKEEKAPHSGVVLIVATS